MAAQSRVACSIHTAYGMMAPIIIDGVMKQGGPLSPLKSTMTTSLGHQWLDDLASESKHTLVIRTKSAVQNDPHLTIDLKQLTVTMAEATDDSFLFAYSHCSTIFLSLYGKVPVCIWMAHPMAQDNSLHFTTSRRYPRDGYNALNNKQAWKKPLEYYLLSGTFTGEPNGYAMDVSQQCSAEISGAS